VTTGSFIINCEIAAAIITETLLPGFFPNRQNVANFHDRYWNRCNNSDKEERLHQLSNGADLNYIQLY